MNLKRLSLSLISLVALGAAFAPNTGIKQSVNQINKFGSRENAGKFTTDFATFADAKEAAEDLNERMTEEGNTLLKNTDNALPMPKGTRLSVFGVMQDNLVGGGDESIADSLKKAGFKVNPTLERFYAKDTSDIRDENLNFGKSVESSFSLYNDGAVMVISRTGGEGADLTTVEDEVVGEGDTHKDLFTDTDGKKHKHYLMLSDSEEKLFKKLKANFTDVHIIINSSHILEVGDLKDDDAVKSILWIGRPGESGTDAVGKIYSGEVNPSGSLTDEWERDFSADPTWQNFGDNSQTGNTNLYYYSDGKPAGANTLPNTFPPMMPGFHGIDYEEGIYLGYRYYESYYKDLADKSSVEKANEWYENAVAYPFGYGLSYTTFAVNIEEGLFTDEGLTNKLGTTVDASIFASSKDHEAQVKKLYLPVTVRNTGKHAGKKSVQVYVTAPYTKGGIEKSFVTFAGFSKTDLLQPGEEETVIVEFNVQDFASYDANDKNGNENKGYELDQGEYTVRVMNGAHFDLATDIEDDMDDYDEVRFTLDATANLKLDDFSGNEVTNLFSEENGFFNATRTGQNGSDMTIMSRNDFDGTFPKAPTKQDNTFPDSFYEDITKWELFDADDTATYASYDTEAKAAISPWVNDFSEIPEGWTQNKDHGKYSLMDVAGIDKNSNTVLTDGAFKDMTGKKAWETFMNSMTWEELVSLPMNGGWSTVAIDSIGLKSTVDNDSPEDFHSTHLWCDSPTIAATMNLELAHEEGIITANLGLLDLGENLTGWYGTGMDTHRTPFSGRNNQYYSQDGLHAGYFAAAVVSGAESRGIICYPKHFALNDQETARDGELNMSWTDEQTMREIYLKPFQMAMQEGGASGCMTSFARVGKVAAPDNYNLLTGLTRKQWGWDGYFVTDGYEGASKSSPMDLMVRAGNDLALGTPGTNTEILIRYDEDASQKKTKKNCDRTMSGTWNATLRGSKGSVEVGKESKVQSDIQYYLVRNTAERMLYKFANSAKTTNGIKLEQYQDATLTAQTQGTAITNLNVKADDKILNGAETEYALVSGALPAGVSLSHTGELTGTPTVSGDFTFTIRAVADNWQVGEATFKLHVNSAFTWDGDDRTKAEVGAEFVGNIDSETVTTQNYNSVTYEISEGKLPAGVELKNNGEISGTPTEAGTFTYTVHVIAKKSVAGFGPFSRTQTFDYYYTDTIVVKEKAVEPGKTIEDIEQEIADLKAAKDAGDKTYTDKIAALEAEIANLKTKDNTDKITALEKEIADLKANKSSGCGGSIIASTSAVLGLSALGFGLVLKKKKEEK